MMTSLQNANLSLVGLSVGDAFGELFFSRQPFNITNQDLPKATWRWTDDTHMALSIVETLKVHGHIHQDELATAFAKRFVHEPWRGYAGGAVRLLQQIANGADWRTASPALFNGGSYGNGGAMRAAPIGGYFFNDLERAATEAGASAEVTHAHPEGQAGAIAVAVAAALAANEAHPSGRAFLEQVLQFVPEGETKQGIERALNIQPDELFQARHVLGTGGLVTAQDTVPFCLWSAAHHLHSYEEALWHTAKGLGDVDTTCAIVGGIVALSAKEIPQLWLERREPLPET